MHAAVPGEPPGEERIAADSGRRRLQQQAGSGTPHFHEHRQEAYQNRLIDHCQGRAFCQRPQVAEQVLVDQRIACSLRGYVFDDSADDLLRSAGHSFLPVSRSAGPLGDGQRAVQHGQDECCFPCLMPVASGPPAPDITVEAPTSATASVWPVLPRGDDQDRHRLVARPVAL